MNADEFDKQWEGEVEEGGKEEVISVEEGGEEGGISVEAAVECLKDIMKENHKDENDEKIINQGSYLVIEE